MPRIDTEHLKIGFKKKEYRAWDNNLLETLKIPKKKLEDKPSLQSAKKQETVKNNEENRSIDLEFDKGSIGVQSGFNNDSNEVLLESNQGSIKARSGFNLGSIGVRVKENNSATLGFNEDSSGIDKLIKKLGGNEQKIFFYVIEICIAKGSLSTGEIPGKIMMNAIATTRNGMETALKRLRKKGLILREKGKTGKNGLIKITILDTVKSEAIKYMHSYQFEQEILNRGVIGVQINQPNRVHLGLKNFTYSSSYNKDTTTALPEEWKKINFVPLESIGFSEQHLLDIYLANCCDPTVIQESIYHFAFGLAEGRHKQYDSPLKVFIGRLRKGNAWIESNYESPREKALRELITRKKAEKEKWDLMVKELVDIEFPEWRKKLTSDDIKKIVPPETLKVNLTPAITAELRMYYIDSILLPRLSNDNQCNDW
jgi:hypothetical protein